MSTLDDYLDQKRDAYRLREARLQSGEDGALTLSASVTAEGRSGIRRIRIRDHQIISDSPPDFAGYDLGPSSPELQLGVLGSCVTHIFLIQAADQEVPLHSLRVAVQATLDPRGGKPGHEGTPFWPHDIRYTVHVDSPAAPQRVQALFASVEAVCPVLNLLKRPQTVSGRLVHTDSVAAKAQDGASESAATRHVA